MSVQIHEDEIRPYDESFTNLGAGFHVDLGGATSVKILRWGTDPVANVPWVNTYGNVRANNGYYELSPEAKRKVDEILTRIEEARK